MNLFETVVKSASFSPCRKHRFELSRVWDASLPKLMVIGLNPSTADETEDDPTIRRCMAFARRERLGGLLMVNMFSLRSTNPKGAGRKLTGRKRVVRYWTPAEIGAADELVIRMRQLKGEDISPPITELDRAFQLKVCNNEFVGGGIRHILLLPVRPIY